MHRPCSWPCAALAARLQLAGRGRLAGRRDLSLAQPPPHHHSAPDPTPSDVSRLFSELVDGARVSVCT
eukprot:6192147-Pleurochrysis_carterae.AAC.9